MTCRSMRRTADKGGTHAELGFAAVRVPVLHAVSAFTDAAPCRLRRRPTGRGGAVRGRGPGENEDLQGEPFVGAAGKFLDEMLTIIDLGRHNCYITNIIKCRPPKNRDPMQTEQDACIDFLRAQTKLLKPKIIVCLGRIAAMRLIRPDFKITREHGQFIEKGGILFTALYHPSALLRDESKRPDTFSDLRALQAKVREVCVRTL